MRAYVAITPKELQSFLDSGSFKTSKALIVAQNNSGNSESDSETLEDLEEMEFESSWQAAKESREMQGPDALGLVLALDLEPDQIGATEGNHIEVLSDLQWSQVQSLLVAESEEVELSWFAAQEIATYLPQWLA